MLKISKCCNPDLSTYYENHKISYLKRISDIKANAVILHIEESKHGKIKHIP